MHASNVALLVLAASAAAPVLAAPLNSHPGGVSGAATLNTRQYTEKKVSPDDCSERPKKAMGLHELPQGPGFMELEPSPMPMPVLNNPSGVQHRDIVDEFVAAIQNPGSGSAVQARGLWTSLAERILGSILRRDGTTGDLAARGNFEDFMNAVTSTGSEGTVESRSFWSQLEEIAAQILRRDDTPGDLAARDEFGDLMNALTNTRSEAVQSRSFLSEMVEIAAQILRRDDTPDDLAARGDFEDFMNAVTSTGSEGTVHSRSFWSQLEEIAAQILRRDDTPGDLAARDEFGDLMNALTNTRSEAVQSRSFWSQLEEIAAQILRRDVTPDDLAARESAEMATEVLRRDVSPDGLIRRYFGNWGSVDPFLDYVMLNLRDLDPEAGILARSIPDGAAETVARRDAADEFLNALLKTRDSPEITPESLLALASLASRTLDDLD